MTSVKKPKLIIISKADHINHEANVIRKRKNLRVKLRNKINTKRIDRMT